MGKKLRILLANFAKMVQDTGGLAKVHCAFANEMARRGHTVAMVYSDDREGDFFFPVRDEVLRYNLRHYGGQSHKMSIAYILQREFLRLFSHVRASEVNDDFTKRVLLPNLR